MSGKKARKALKSFNQKQNQENKAAKAEFRQEIAERNEQQKKALAFNHHCPVKDAASAHTIKTSCLKKRHVGYCPSCFGMVSFKYGCSIHRWKGDKLVEKLPADLQAALAANRANGMLGPEGADARTLADQNEAAEEAEQEDEWQPEGEFAWQVGEEEEQAVQQEGQQAEAGGEVQGGVAEQEEPIPAPAPRRRRANEPR